MNHRQMTRAMLLMLLLPVVSARAEAPSFPDQALVMEGFQGVLWVQTSVEHQALCRQAFGAATALLDTAMADPNWHAALEQGDEQGLPPAVVVDVDETMLDNSPFHGALLKEGRSFDQKLFAGWVDAAIAEPLPGALEFARAARARGAEVFYVTNRKVGQETATRVNLARHGFPLNDHIDTVLMRAERPEWLWDKTTRRAAIARHYRIIMLIGDDFNDFFSGARTMVEQRRAQSERFQDWWGSRWFILPNPTYGSWLGAIYNYEWGIPDDDKRRLRQRVLDVFSLPVP